MLEKDPNFWANLLTTPSLQGAVMASIISFLRVLYDAKETSKVRIILESLICGGLSLSASSIIEFMEWPPSLSIGAGGAIGFLGVTVIRGFITRFIERKTDAI